MPWRDDYGVTGAVLDYLEGELSLEEARAVLPWKDQATDKLLGKFKDLAGPRTDGSVGAVVPAPKPRKIWKSADYVASLSNPVMNKQDLIEWDPNIEWPAGAPVTYRVGGHRVRCQSFGTSIVETDEGSVYVIELAPIAIVAMEENL